ncbi:ATP-binding protein, partial [candidate division KSB1 bacterium]|nr:ATP-binding protein [candidate division KSB1 bacterium]
TATFVGTEFSSITGRGEAGEPRRKTPWGELAFQVGGPAGFELFKEHDDRFVPPAGDDLNKLFDREQPYLILLDELLNYVSKHRNYHNLAAQFYNFLQTLTEFVRSRPNIVLAVSIPASEMEMNTEDHADYDRFKKLLDRLGKAMFMSAEKETTEIIRRRLFEWHGMPDDARKTISEYVTWLQEHRAQVSFNVENARAEFEAAYPFHPAVLSLFERKWQTLPRFQQTRGILRLLALWISRAYSEGFKKTIKDPLITLGAAPLEDQNFRAAVFEQLGENRLEAAVTSDIAGKEDAHAVGLDAAAIDAIKKARLHRKVATIIFFESNGGQSKDKLATIPEIKLSVGEPDLDIGLVDSVLQALIDSCYYLTAANNKYKFSTQENLIKRFSDRRAGILTPAINELVELEVRKVFEKGTAIGKIMFPEKNNQISDRPVLVYVVLHPAKRLKDSETKTLMEDFVRNNGQSARTYKSGLFFCVAEDETGLKEEARKFLAWEAIYDEADDLRLTDDQRRMVKQSMERAKKDLTETVWKSYKNLFLLDRSNQLRHIDLGLVHSSQARTLTDFYTQHLQSIGEITDEINPNYLVRNWPPAFIEWSTKNVRDAFYAAPQFPRLLNPDSIKQTIAKGVSNGFLAYIGKKGNQYEPFIFNQTLNPFDVEISDEMYIVTAEEARKHIEPRKLTTLKIIPPNVNLEPQKSYSFVAKGYDQHNDEINVTDLEWETTNGAIDKSGKLIASDVEGIYKITTRFGDVTGSAMVTVNKKQEISGPQPDAVKPSELMPSKPTRISWSGRIQPNKWTIFYTKVLARFASNPNLKITVSFELQDDQNLTEQKIEETKSALKEMGLGEEVE